MVAEVFSIGFGPALWKRRVRETTYKIGALPFGGYVALPQMEPSGGEAAKDDAAAPPHPALPPIAPWRRIVVAAAGAAGNGLLAVALAWIVFWTGKPSAPHERRCRVGFVETNSTAAAQGLLPGDTLAAYNGRPVANWQDLLTELSLAAATQATFTVSREDAPARDVVLPVRKATLGVRMPEGLLMEDLCRVGGLVRGGSAEAAGLRPGDLVVELAGTPLFSRAHLIDTVARHANRRVPALVKRGSELHTLWVTPAYDEKERRPLIGILFSQIAVDYDTVVHPRPSAQLREHATAILRFLRALVTPRESRAAAGAVGGPVLILYTYWQMVQGSLRLALWFTVFLNVNLAILNLLPIPVLDGGHILFSAWEWATRRPVGPRALGWIYRVFASLLIALFLLLTFRDAIRFVIPSFRRDSAAPAGPEPPAAATNAAPAPAP
jgi:regulator of sigma E protease